MRIPRKLSLLFASGLALALLTFAAPALAAETTGPQWTVSSVSRPTTFAVGSNADSYVVLVTNTGGAAAGCTRARWETEFKEHGLSREAILACPEDSPAVNPITISDVLPAGLEALPGATGEDEAAAAKGGGGGNFSSSCAATSGGGVACSFDGLVVPDDSLVLRFPVRVTAGAGSIRNVVRVTGGGAAVPGVRETPTVLAGSEAEAKARTAFGIAEGGATTALSSVQAGGHPDLTTTGAFNTESASGATVGAVNQIVDDLPAGFAGDLVDTPACQSQLFAEEDCPIPTQVGITTQVTDEGGNELRFLRPVYNLAPEPGEVAKIGFFIGVLLYEGDITVRAPGEGGPPCAVSNATACEPYGLKTVFHDVSAVSISYDSFSLTIWGVPASPVHDPLRWKSEPGGFSTGTGFGVSDPLLPAPYFTSPTACTSEQLDAELHVSSWASPDSYVSEPMPIGPLDGCDRLGMTPVLKAETTSDAAYAATGLSLEEQVPQTYDNAEGLATSTLKKEVVTLPEGVTANPSVAAGLQGCTPQQYAEEGVAEKTAQERSEGRGCPSESKIGTVKIVTPSLSEEVKGTVFLATPYDNLPEFGDPEHPGGSLLALYVVARVANRGVLVKAPGEVVPNLETGRLTTTFDDLAPLPFSLLTFTFNSGANAPLVTPPTCGSFRVTAELTPWANPEGNPLDPSIPPFPIDADCPTGNVPPFNPGVTSYPVHPNAGAYSPLYLKISRQDGEQEITGFSTTFPLGLVANLNGVAKCGEAEVARARQQTGVQAETEPACPAGSEIGYSIAEAGVGSVLAQNPGKIYLGGEFDGAPFSVVSVTSAHVGPFDLGTVVIHFPLDIDSETAQVTIPAGVGGANQIPHILDGIVVHLRNVRVYVNRQGFMVNPTRCAEQKLSATVLGNGPFDNQVTAGDPFQLAGCEALHYEPKVHVASAAKTSKADGASLNFKLSFPPNTIGQDSNTREVKVELPVQLPSRLTTLQKACTQAQFKANPEGCPAASRIGTARAQAAILPEPLEGPIYFVSNGGEAFPNLVLDVKGDGVTFHSIGDTFISKTGITSTTFHSVPDVPLESVEVNLPEGPYSALAANGNLCAPTTTKTVKKKVTVKVKSHGHVRKKQVTRKVKETAATTLQMPTEFVPQNGTAAVKQLTPIEVTGCPKKAVHPKKVAKKAARKHHVKQRRG